MREAGDEARLPPREPPGAPGPPSAPPAAPLPYSSWATPSVGPYARAAGSFAGRRGLAERCWGWLMEPMGRTGSGGRFPGSLACSSRAAQNGRALGWAAGRGHCAVGRGRRCFGCLPEACAGREGVVGPQASISRRAGFSRLAAAHFFAGHSSIESIRRLYTDTPYYSRAARLAETLRRAFLWPHQPWAHFSSGRRGAI